MGSLHWSIWSSTFREIGSLITTSEQPEQVFFLASNYHDNDGDDDDSKSNSSTMHSNERELSEYEDPIPSLYDNITTPINDNIHKQISSSSLRSSGEHMDMDMDSTLLGGVNNDQDGPQAYPIRLRVGRFPVQRSLMESFESEDYHSNHTFESNQSISSNEQGYDENEEKKENPGDDYYDDSAIDYSHVLMEIFKLLFTFNLNILFPHQIIKLMNLMAEFENENPAMMNEMMNIQVNTLTSQEQMTNNEHVTINTSSATTKQDVPIDTSSTAASTDNENEPKIEVHGYKGNNVIAQRFTVPLTTDRDHNVEMLVDRDYQHTLFIEPSKHVTNAILTARLDAVNEEYRDQEKGTDRTSMVYCAYVNPPKAGDTPLQCGVWFSGKDEIIEMKLPAGCDKIYIVTTSSSPPSFKRCDKPNQLWRSINLKFELKSVSQNDVKWVLSYKLVSKTEVSVERDALAKAKKKADASRRSYHSSNDEVKDEKKCVKSESNSGSDSEQVPDSETMTKKRKRCASNKSNKRNKK